MWMGRATKGWLALAVLALIPLLAVGDVVPVAAGPQGDATDQSLEAAREGSAEGHSTVVITTDQTFADALGVVPMTHPGLIEMLTRPVGPVVLHPPGPDLDPRVAEHIEQLQGQGRLGDGVIILGGTAAIPESVEQQIRELLEEGCPADTEGSEERSVRGFNPDRPAVGERGFQLELSPAGCLTRIAGLERTETSRNLAQTVFPDAEVAFAVRAFGTPDNPTAAFADSMTVGVPAAYLDAPVVLVNGQPTQPGEPPLSHDTIRYFIESPIMDVVLTGGRAAIGTEAEDQLQAVCKDPPGFDVPDCSRLLGVWRVGGDNREHTADLLQHLAPLQPTDPLTIVNGYDLDAWQIALPWTRLAAEEGGLQLVNNEVLSPQAIRGLLHSQQQPRIGPAIDADTRARIEELSASTELLGVVALDTVDDQAVSPRDTMFAELYGSTDDEVCVFVRGLPDSADGGGDFEFFIDVDGEDVYRQTALFVDGGRADRADWAALCTEPLPGQDDVAEDLFRPRIGGNVGLQMDGRTRRGAALLADAVRRGALFPAVIDGFTRADVTAVAQADPPRLCLDVATEGFTGDITLNARVTFEGTTDGIQFDTKIPAAADCFEVGASFVNGLGGGEFRVSITPNDEGAELAGTFPPPR